MSPVLGAFGLLDFTKLRPVVVLRASEIYEPFDSLIFHFVSGRGEPRILIQWIRGHGYTLYNINQC
jgi:hypothetical protein